MPSLARRALAITDALSDDLDSIGFDHPVRYVYAPLNYARPAWEAYLERYLHRGVPSVLVGMNPGPWGMMQTGIPFGDVGMVRDWLAIEAPVRQPREVHPKRPVLGFACARREVSGQRLWGWAQARLGTAEAFFQEFFVYNYCPLGFLGETGANVTPDKLAAAERAALCAACDGALAALVDEIGPARVIGVGQFAAKRIRESLADMDIEVGQMPHPSPASPAANRGWAKLADAALADMGL